MKAVDMNAKPNKYNAQKQELDGYTFDSRAEARRYQELRVLEQAGEIYGLDVHPSYLVMEGFYYRGERVRAITYVADFSYTERETGRRVVEDVKGVRTQVYRIKVKLLKSRCPDLWFREVGA
jgi:hypothetical protein